MIRNIVQTRKLILNKVKVTFQRSYTDWASFDIFGKYYFIFTYYIVFDLRHAVAKHVAYPLGTGRLWFRRLASMPSPNRVLAKVVKSCSYCMLLEC